MSKPPIILASVFRMPTFLRPLRETTRIERVSSYSTGRPRSKNGMTTSSSPEVKATPRKISADVCLACVGREAPAWARSRTASRPRGPRSSRARSATRLSWILPPLRACVFREQAQQVGLGLDVLAGDLRAVVRLDQHRPVVGDLLDQRRATRPRACAASPRWRRPARPAARSSR